jgi:hypothetical protein
VSRHPSLEELLAIDDGDARPEVVRHLAECPSCGAQRRDLEHRRDELRALPLLRPTEDRWPIVRARVAASRRRRTLVGGAIAAALLIFALSTAAIFQKRTPSTVDSVDQREPSTVDSVDQLAELIQQSQRREQRLRSLSGQEVMDIASADAIVQIEDQIALVDECIAGMGIGSESRQALGALWQTRITLLDTLAQMRNPAFARLMR